MKRKIVLLVLVLMNLTNAGILAQSKDAGYIMTVNGVITIEEMGKTLIHEHIVTNFEGTEYPNQPFEDPEKAIKVILPYLLHLKSLGFKDHMEELGHLAIKRPEQLSVAEFIEITKVLSK